MIRTDKDLKRGGYANRRSGARLQEGWLGKRKGNKNPARVIARWQFHRYQEKIE